jgi:hypothetical protein
VDNEVIGAVPFVQQCAAGGGWLTKEGILYELEDCPAIIVVDGTAKIERRHNMPVEQNELGATAYLLLVT